MRTNRAACNDVLSPTRLQAGDPKRRQSRRKASASERPAPSREERVALIRAATLPPSAVPPLGTLRGEVASDRLLRDPKARRSKALPDRGA